MSSLNNNDGAVGKQPDVQGYQEPHFLGYYLGILRRRFWLVLLVVTLFSTVGLVRAFRLPDIYRATAKILLVRQLPQAMKADGVIPDSMWWDPDYYQTQAELMKSREVLELALEDDEIAGMFLPEDTEPAVEATYQPGFMARAKHRIMALLGGTPPVVVNPWERMRDALKVEQMEGTHFLLVSVESTEPAVAARIANAGCRAFEKFSLQDRQETYGDTFAFLKGEKEKAEQALISAQKEQQEFREKSRTVSFEASEDKQPVMEALARLNAKRGEIQLERIRLVSELSVIREGLAHGGEGAAIHEADLEFLLSMSSVRSDPAVTAADRNLNEAIAATNRLALIYGPDHPRIAEANAELARRRGELNTALGQVLVNINNRTLALEEQEKQLKEEYEQQQEEALSLARELFEFTRINNELERQQRIFNSISDRLIEIGMGAGFTRANVRVAEEATVPTTPVGPRRRQMAFFALFLGLITGLGLALAVEHLDDTVKTPEDMRNLLRIPVLGFIPHIRRNRSNRNKYGDVSRRGTMAFAESMSSVAESYRNIRSSLFFSLAGDAVKVVGFTSCMPGEGKTTTASNVAVTIAMAHKRVLLIDGDLHRPMLHRIFPGIKSPDDSVKTPASGVTSILTGRKKPAHIVRKARIGDDTLENLHLLPAGPEEPNPAELLSSTRMQSFMEWARKNYDWVIIDMPPVLFVSDAGILSRQCDGVVLVVKSGAGNRTMLSRVMDHMRTLNVRMLGGVINDLNIARVGRYSSSYYYYGYSKYDRGYHKSYRSARDKRDGAPGD